MVSVDKIELGRGVSALCDITMDAIIVKIEYPAAQITHNCKGVTCRAVNTGLIWFRKVVFIVQIYQHFTGPFKNFNSLLKAGRSFALLKPFFFFFLSTARLHSSSPAQNCFVTLPNSFHPERGVVSRPGLRRDRHSVFTSQPTNRSGSRRSRERR